MEYRLSDWVVPKLHRISALRSLAKQFFRGWTIQQSFHGGVICLDAVEHSWAWTGNRRYQTFDSELQEKLLLLSGEYEQFIDIGSNIGAIVLSVLLRNRQINAICIDPNSRAIALLKESLRLNNLSNRVSVVEAAVSDSDGVLTFDESGSVTGHVSNSGKQVACINFVKLINEKLSDKKCLVKIDIEGFETILLKHITEIKPLDNLCLVIELHPLKFNDIGNPQDCLNLLLAAGAKIEDLQGQPLNQLDENNFTQVIAKWFYA